MRVPFNRSYWVIPGKLMAGCYPGDPNPVEAARKLRGLLAFGIRSVVNLMQPHELDHSGNAFIGYEEPLKSLAREMGVEVSLKRFPIKDMGIPSRSGMGCILDYIDASIEQGRLVYVHCWGVRGRTGTVVGCYLARHGLASDRKVLEKIKELRRDVADAHFASPKTNQHMDMVLSWIENE